MEGAQQLYFVRHGESEANLLNEFSNRGLNHPLTDKGRRQAYELAEKLKNSGIKRIYHSPILRAIQTAEILATELEAPRESAEALREYDVGDLEGRSDKPAWDMYWEISNAWLHQHDFDRRFQGGESFNDMKRRFVPFIDHVIQANRDVDGNILLLAHGGIYRCMLPIIFSNVDFAFTETNHLGHTVVVTAERRPEGIVCTKWGDTKVAD